MSQAMMTIIILVVCFLTVALVRGKECAPVQDKPTSIICSNPEHIMTNLTYYLSNFSTMTELSLVHSYLTEMPEIDNARDSFIVLRLDHNQIQLFNRNYSSLESLHLSSNHIYSLHQTNLYYPNLKYLDLSHNPIEHIIDNFFTDEQFPRLQVLKLTNALSNVNPYLIENRFLSFASMSHLQEISLDENDFEDFSCTSNATHIQWQLPASLRKISFGKNKLATLDAACFSATVNLTELDLHYNFLRALSNPSAYFPNLSKLQLDYNLFTNIPSTFLQSLARLTDLDLSANQFKFDEIKSAKRSPFPSSLTSLSLNSMNSELTCAMFENLRELEQLQLAHLGATQVKSCLWKKLISLRTVSLRYHRLKTFDESVFRSLLTLNQLRTLDISSYSLRCSSCSLRWLVELLRAQNRTRVTCLDDDDKDVLISTLELSACSSSHISSTVITVISLAGTLSLLVLFVVYAHQHRRFPFSKFSSVYHMIPLRHHDRIYQHTTEDITNDNVMLVT